MVYLHDVDTMREFLENNKIIGATDSEIKAFYEVFEGHGYDLFARDLNDSVFIRFDSCGSDFSYITELGDIDETDEEHISINSIEYELGYAYEMLEELYEEYYKNDEHESMIDCGNARNLVGDLISRTYDKDRTYIVSYSSTSNFSLGCDDTVEVFDNEVDAFANIKDSIKFILKNYKVEEDRYECEDTDFNNEIEVEKYMIDYRERDEFLLIHNEGSLQIKLTIKDKVKKEQSMEFYTLVDDYINYNCYEKNVNVSHYKTKEEGLKEFKSIVENYKHTWIDTNDYLDEGKLGEYDELNEYENDNISYFNLFLDDQCYIQVSLEKVVL